MTQRLNKNLLAFFTIAAAVTSSTAFAQDSAGTMANGQSAASQPATAQSADAATTTPAKTSWNDLDINKDGNLSKAEAAGVPSLAAVFDNADTNADGALTGEEYKAYLGKADHGKDKPKK